MKYQPGDIIQCWGGFALVKAVHEDYLEVNYSAADKPADFRVSLDWIDGHWVPGKHRDDSAILDWLCANTGKDGDIRKAVKRAMEAEGERK